MTARSVRRGAPRVEEPVGEPAAWTRGARPCGGRAACAVLGAPCWALGARGRDRNEPTRGHRGKAGQDAGVDDHPLCAEDAAHTVHGNHVSHVPVDDWLSLVGCHAHVIYTVCTQRICMCGVASTVPYMFVVCAEKETLAECTLDLDLRVKDSLSVFCVRCVGTPLVAATLVHLHGLGGSWRPGGATTTLQAPSRSTPAPWLVGEDGYDNDMRCVSRLPAAAYAFRVYRQLTWTAVISMALSQHSGRCTATHASTTRMTCA